MKAAKIVRETLAPLKPFRYWPKATGASVRADFWAGMTVSLVLIPQAMAYAELAGLPMQMGLFTALLPGMIAAMWGSSWSLSTGPMATSSLITAAVIASLGATSSGEVIALAGWLAILTGTMRLALGLLRFAFLINLVSSPVIRGFTNAAALLIVFSQVPTLLGVAKPDGGAFHLRLWSLLSTFHHVHLPTVAISAGSIGILIAMKRLSKRSGWMIPGALIAMVVMTVGVAIWASIDASAVASIQVVGAVPTHLPKLAMPAISGGWFREELLAGAAIITLVGFMEVAAMTRAIAEKSRQRLDMNQELVGQGLASLTSGFSGGYAPSGSFSRTALNSASHNASPLSAVLSSLTVLLALLLIMPLLHYLPKAVLAAMIIVSIVKMIDFADMRAVFRVSMLDGCSSVLTFALTLLLSPHLEVGILVGGAVALLVHLGRSMKPRMIFLAVDAYGQLVDAERFNLPIDPRRPVIRFQSSLSMVSIQAFENTIHDQVKRFGHPPTLVICGEPINDIDASGVKALKRLVLQLREEGTLLVFYGLNRPILKTFGRTGLDDILGPTYLFTNYHSAMEFLGDR